MVHIDPEAVVVLQDGSSCHDPIAASGAFEALLARDRDFVEGASLLRQNRRPVSCRQIGALVPAGPRRAAADVIGAVSGMTTLPNDAGFCARALTASSVAAQQVASNLFTAAILHRFGIAPEMNGRAFPGSRQRRARIDDFDVLEKAAAERTQSTWTDSRREEGSFDRQTLSPYPKHVEASTLRSRNCGIVALHKR